MCHYYYDSIVSGPPSWRSLGYLIAPCLIRSRCVDPSAELPKEIYFIERKILENRDVVQFELVSTFDLVGISAPKKLATREDFIGIGTFVNA